MTPLLLRCCSWWWVGESRGVSPEVHDHLHCLERVELQVVKIAPDSQLLNLLSEADSSPPWMRPMTVVSSANFKSLTEGSLDVQSLVYREKSSGERTQPWGAPVLVVRVLDVYFPSLTSCCLSVRKLVIHWQMEVGTENWVNLGWRQWQTGHLEHREFGVLSTVQCGLALI